MDYAVSFFSPVLKFPWLKLDGIQFQAIRSSLGMMKTTSTNVLLSEAGLTSYQLRARYITDKTLINFKQYPNEPLYKV